MTMLSDGACTPLPSSHPRSRQVQHVDEEDEWLFSCRCESVKPVSTLLTCLKGTSSLQPVTVFVSPSSITFHVYGTARQSQASVDLQAGLFSHYQVNRASNGNANENADAGANGNPANTNAVCVTDATDTNDSSEQQHHNEWQLGGEFCVNLSTVLECLFVLGTHALEKTKLSMSYNLHTEIFKLELLEEGGVLSTAAIPGMVPPAPHAQDGDSSLAHAFRSTPIVARIILKSDFLREALQEMDVVSGATTCTILLSSQKGLEFVTVGNQSDCVITIPASCSCISSLECAAGGARTYPMSSIQSAMRGLEFAEETCVSINENGMIAIQHQILDTVGQGSPNFVDYIMTCLLSNDDDDEESSATIASAAASGRGTQERPMSSQGMSQSQTSLERPYSLGWAEGNDQVTPKATMTASQRNGATVATTNGAVRPHAVIDNHHHHHDEEEDDDDLPPASTVQLFGTLETESRSGASRSSSRRRRRISHNNSVGDKNEKNDHDDDGNHDASSQPLLFGKHDEDDDDDDRHKPTIDVTARATPPRRGRLLKCDEYDGSSSPELVYK